MQFHGPVQPGVDIEGETCREGNVKASLGVRNKRSIVKSGMWGNVVCFRLCEAPILALLILAYSSCLLQKLGQTTCYRKFVATVSLRSPL